MTESEFEKFWKEKARPHLRFLIEELNKEHPIPTGMLHSSLPRWQAIQDGVAYQLDLLDGEEEFQTFPNTDPRASDFTDEELEAYFYRACRYQTVVGRTAVEAEDLIGREPHMMRINAPAWYRNPEFRIWLNSPGTATWKRPGDDPDEGSDVFFTCNLGEGGSDYPGDDQRPGIPKEIWEHLEFMVAERFGWDAEVLVWVSNLSE